MNNFLRKVGSKCFSLFFPRLTDLERRLQKVYDVKEQWRKLNKHNYTTVSNNVYDLPFPISKVKVGNYTYGSLHVYSYDSDDEQLIIGSFCSIAPESFGIAWSKVSLGNSFSPYQAPCVIRTFSPL